MTHVWGKRAGASLVTATLVTFATFATLLAACGERMLPPNAPNVARLCVAKCERLAACRPGWDVDTCEQDCRRDQLLPYFRDDYSDAIAQCLSTASCDAILAGAARACWQKTIPEPTDLARQACLVAENRDRVCVGSPVDVEACLTKWRWGILKDSVLTQFMDCEQQRCGGYRRSQCVRATMGIQ